MKKWIAGLVCLCALALQAPIGLAAEDFPAPALTRVKCNLRSGPSTNHTIQAVIGAGAMITLQGKEGAWYLVAYQSKTGYIREDLVTNDQLSGASSSTGSSSSNSAGASGITRTLQYGSKGSDVSLLQQRLVDLGYGPLSVTGNYSTNTVAAVKRFQRVSGLSSDGISGPKTLSRLFGSAANEATSGSSGSTNTNTSGSTGSSASGSYPTLRSGSTGSQVRLVQQRLRDLGYFSNSVTGTYGSITVAAVKAFQRATGLVADGIAGVQTQRMLFEGSPVSAGNSGSSGTSATPAPSSSSTGSSGSSSGGIDNSADYPMLKKGASGTAVTRLQEALIALEYMSGSASGYYDDATYDAVKAFQTNNATGVDGVAGPATQRILYERNPRPASAGPVPRETLAPGVGQMSGPSTSQVELAHWFNDVKLNYRNGQVFTAYDPASGLGWNLKIYAMGRHCDSEPVTQQDTDIMFAAFGNRTTWDPKPVFCKMPDGRWILATTHNTPHLTGSIKDNGFDGHLCVHFFRDMDEVTKNDPNYGVSNQNVLRAYWETIKH